MVCSAVRPHKARLRNMSKHCIKHRSPRPSLKGGFGRLSASFDLFDICSLLSAGLGASQPVLGSYYGNLSASFEEEKEKKSQNF